jgi:hypothetical protein
VSAALCVGVLSVLGVLFLAWPFTLWFALAVIGIKDRIAVEIFSGTAGLLLCAPALYVGLIFGRFVLRAAPPRTSGRPRVVVFVVLVLIGAWALLTVLYFAREMEVDLAYKLIFGLTCALWLAGIFVLVGSRHLRPRAFLQRPYLLYLRRFSTFADRAVIAVILKHSPADVPVVFLTPTRSGFGDWNPFLVCFAGMKFRHPFRSSPYILRAADADWEPVAKELVEHANLVIVDDSEGSDAIRTELEMIGSADRWARTVIIGDAQAPAAASRPPQAHKKGTRVVYRKSWLRAWPRLVGGLTGLVLVWPLLWFFSSYLVAFLIGQVRAFGYDLEPLMGGYREVIPVALLVLLPYGYFAFFVRPAIDRTFQRQLLTLVREAPTP